MLPLTSGDCGGKPGGGRDPIGTLTRIMRSLALPDRFQSASEAQAAQQGAAYSCASLYNETLDSLRNSGARR